MKAIKKAGSTVDTASGVKINASYLNSRLSLYLVPPVGEITVEELELYAIDRLKGKIRLPLESSPHTKDVVG